MKIEYNTTKRGHYTRGQIQEVDDADGNRLICAGVARVVELSKPTNAKSGIEDTPETRKSRKDNRDES